MTELVDCHSHTELSGHGEGTIAQTVARARELGLTTYCQTEHLWLPERLDPTHEVSMSHEQTAFYLEELQRQRAQLEDEGCPLELVIGIEADWLNGRADELAELCEPYEYVIGSVHYIDEWPFDDPAVKDRWEEQGVDAIWQRYFEVWMDMAQSSAPITTFGHPDLVKKFGFFPSFDPREHYSAMAQAAARKGCMIEVNTAGWRNIVNEAYPTLDLLKMFRDAGVECTVGCDAHKPADVGRGVQDAYALMRRAGYEYVSVPTKDGDRRRVKLEV